MMNEIVTFGHPSLKSKSVNITEFDETLKKLSERMIKIMYEAPGVGLAAPQIGINKNIFVFGIGGSYEGPKLLHEFTETKDNLFFITGPDKDEFLSLVKPKLKEKN